MHTTPTAEPAIQIRGTVAHTVRRRVGAVGNAPDPRAQAVGHVLKELRQAQGWGQARLAKQLGTDKSQVSKREQGHHLPQRQTLLKYAEVFQLSEAEKRNLFELAGYAPEKPPVESGDFTRALASVRDEWLSAQWPAAVLVDAHWTLWHASDSFARLFSSRQAGDLSGRHMLELCFDPALGMREALSRICDEVEIDRFITHLVGRFRSQFRPTQSEPWWKDLEQRLRTQERFAEVWDAPRRGRKAGSVATLVYINLSEGGRVIMVGGPTRTDERFILALLLPADARSAAVLEWSATS